MRRTRREQEDLRAIADAISDGDLASQAPSSRPLPGVVVLAFALWAGCAIGTSRAMESSAGTTTGAVLLAGAASLAVLRRFATRRARLAIATPLALVALAAAILGAGWSILRVEADRQLVERLAHACDGDRAIVRIAGVVSTPPRGRPPGDRLHAFFRPPSKASFDLDVSSIGPPDDRWRVDLEGRVRVSLREGAAPWQVGDRVVLTGTFLPVRPAPNPGARPASFATLEPIWIGSVDVPDPRLVEIDPSGSGPVEKALRSLERVRFGWQQGTRALLDQVLAEDPSGIRRDLLRALLLGDRRGQGYADLREDFAAAGLAHFLAISGFNLAVVAGVASIAANLIGIRPRRRGLVVVAAMALYIVALPAQLPVLRAGLSATLLALGLVGARRWDGRAATGLAAIVLLAIAPGESIRPGFQLSFAAVFSLQELAPRLRRRWFGEPDRLGRSNRSILASRGADAIAACVSAWAISTPIALHNFGLAALLGVPATLLATPLVAATVAFAAIAMPLAALAPGTAPVSGSILLIFAASILAIADTIASVPHGSLRIDPPSAAACLVVLAAVLAWLRASRRIASWCAVALCGAILAVAVPSRSPGDSIDATFLAIGDGTAIVVRRGSSASLVDCGSVGDRRAGGSTALRAIESLGIRRLDAVFTSHPNLDHYSGLVEVLARHREARWFVGEAFIAAARRSPDGPESAALAWAAELGRVPCLVSAGDAIEVGGLAIRCLHPPAGRDFDSANDASLVLRVDPIESVERGPSTRPILLTTGDLEPRGLAHAGEAIDAVEPWIAEVPHHGSATPEAARLLLSKPRTVWVQSTGRRRLEPDSLGAMIEEVKEVGEVGEIQQVQDAQHVRQAASIAPVSAIDRIDEVDMPKHRKAIRSIDTKATIEVDRTLDPIRLITARDGAISARFTIERLEPMLVSIEHHAGRWRSIRVPAR